jgi:heptaprenyl diphosphate synthase
MKYEIKNLTRGGILVTIALVLSVAERLLPLSVVVPLPGIKLGLANIVTMYALFYLSTRSAFAITLSRCLLASVFMGGPTSLIFSLCGAAFALTAMLLLKRGYGRFFTMLGVSIGGALAHNLGQIFAASLILRSSAVFSYLPVLTYVGIFTGAITAIVANSVFSKLPEKKLLN